MKGFVPVLGLVMSTVVAQAGLPDSGGIWCPSISKSPPLVCGATGALSNADNAALPQVAAALGSHNSPARAPVASGGVHSGSRSIATGFAHVPEVTLGVMGDMNLQYGQPLIRRTDGDYSSNGLFGLSVERNFIESGSNYSANQDGHTLLGRGWLLNYEIRLEKYGGAMGLRNSEGTLVPFRQVGTVWQANPAVMAATLMEIANPLNLENYRLHIGDGDAIYGFDGYGYLMYMEDRNGNKINLTYISQPGHPDRKLINRVSASAPDNRYLQFEYYDPYDATDHRTRRLKRVSTSWNSRFVDYEYTPYDSSAWRSGELWRIKDSYGRVIEQYDRVMPDFVNNLIDSDFLKYEQYSYSYWFNVYRPDVNGNVILVNSYIVGNMIDPSITTPAKFDRYGTRLIWYSNGMWFDANGLAIEYPFSGTEHVYAPEYVPIWDYSDPQNPYIVKTLEQKMRSDVNMGINSSMIPQGQCYDAEPPSGGGASASSCLAYEYQPWNPYSSDPYDYSFAKPSVIQRPGELATYYFYDETTHRLSGIWQADDRCTSYTFDSKGNVNSVTVNGEFATTYTLDSLGRVFQKRSPLGTVTYTHDNWGNITSITDEEGFQTINLYDARGLKVATGARGTTTTYAYDSMDRLTTVTNHLGHATVYTYNYIDQIIAVTDPMGNATLYDYSPTTGTLTSVEDAEGGVINYEYDWAGKLVKLTDQRGYSTTYAYDVFGRLKSETNPLNQTTSYTYDDTGGCGSCGTSGNGNLASKTDPAGRTTYYAYDAADRLTTVTYSGSSDMVVHSYDDYGQRIATFDNRLPTDDFPTQTFSWTYDKFGRMLTEIYPDGEQVSWTYDINGRRTTLTDPDGNETRYLYYDLPNNKNLSTIFSPFADGTWLYYDSRGRLIEEISDTAYEKWYGYDALNRLTGVQTWGRDPYSGTLDIMNSLSRYDLTFDASGMIRQMSTSQRFNPAGWAEVRQRKYTYDNVHRLTSEERVRSGQVLWRDTYEYDAAGNRISKHHYDGSTTVAQEYHYNAFNQLESTGPILEPDKVFSYDDAGNLATGSRYGDSEHEFIYTHSIESRLDTAVRWGVSNYVYDFSGRLLYAKNAGDGKPRKYYYDGISALLTKEQFRKFNKDNPSIIEASCWRTIAANVLKDAPIGQVMNQRRWDYGDGDCSGTATLSYVAYHYDHIGNVLGTSVCDGLGTPLDAYDMDAFGNVIEGEQEGIHLTTKHYDAVSQLYYFGARWYDPEAGRWIEKEPLGLDGPNLYHFNFNSPMVKYDSDGRMVFLLPMLPAAATVACECAIFAGSAAVAAYGTVCLYRAVDETATASKPKLPPPDYCLEQWIADVAWCNANYTGVQNVGCRARAGDNLARCRKGQSRLPRKPEVY